MPTKQSSDRRQMIAGGLGLGTLAAAASLAMADEQAVDGPSVSVEVESTEGPAVESAGGSVDAEITQLDDGFDVAPLAIGQISQAFRTFTFVLGDGDFSEQTSAVPRPNNAGFVTFLNTLNYAFVTSSGSTTIKERPLGQFFARVGLRGNNLVCTVRLTDRNADDAVRITVSAGVLFWTS
ncbi:MAG: hypothetical protein KDA44_02555 [Planctomycetales bacterium]|nr:hypothetical protein [Planctomycetales bacterium]